MAANEYLDRADQFTTAAPIEANDGVGPISGDPLLLGTLPCIAENSYTPPGSREATGNITVKFIGANFLSVVAKSSLSPSTNAAIAVGDPIYASGTKDATTGITYDVILSGDDSGVLFGIALAAVTSGATATIPVKLAGVGVAL